MRREAATRLDDPGRNQLQQVLVNLCTNAWHALPDGVGRIVAELEKQHLLDNTLLLFLQDNGGIVLANDMVPTNTADYSAYILKVRSLKPDFVYLNLAGVDQTTFLKQFKEYGLPAAMRTDNGVPFATQALHGLSYLNVWWMRLGVGYQRIHPGCPQENGAHERMHRTLKRRTARPHSRSRRNPASPWRPPSGCRANR